MIPFKPVVEGKVEGAFLTEAPRDVARSGGLANVPWITGVVTQDGALKAACKIIFCFPARFQLGREESEEIRAFVQPLRGVLIFSTESFDKNLLFALFVFCVPNLDSLQKAFGQGCSENNGVRTRVFAMIFAKWCLESGVWTKVFGQRFLDKGFWARVFGQGCLDKSVWTSAWKKVICLKKGVCTRVFEQDSLDKSNWFEQRCLNKSLWARVFGLGRLNKGFLESGV